MIKSEKAPIAKGRSYILKTSMLEDVLVDAGIEVEIQLVYWTPQIDGSILEASYWMQNPNVTNRRVHVRAGSLPSVERQRAQHQLSEIGLPAFVSWLSVLHRQPDSAPMLYAEPRLELRYLRGDLQIVSKPPASDGQAIRIRSPRRCP